MDKNTIIGFLLILVVLIGFSYLNRPSPEQIEAQKRYNDSITFVQQQAISQEIINSQNQAQTGKIENENLPDSVVKQELQRKYGNFTPAVQGEEQFVTMENDFVRIVLSSKGGRIYSAQLKQYSNYAKDPLMLFDGNKESDFKLTFFTPDNHELSTSDFYFEVSQTTDLQTTLSLKSTGNGSLDFVYTLHPDDYMVDFEVFARNLENELSPAIRTLNLYWMQKIRQQEKGRKFEDRYAYLSYKYLSDDVEHLRETKSDEKIISNKVKWIGYKDQFFSSVLIAKENFESVHLKSEFQEGDYLKQYTTLASVPFIGNSPEGLKFNYYFGPNDYSLLKNYDKTKFEGQNLELEKLVPLGWSLFRYVNKWLIIPIFDWLTSWCGSLGLAIFLLTLIIKSALFPLTYKSFMSSAKMRALRPQIEQITAKYPGQENAMTRQQKNMELYRQVGVNPMAGCLPMLLQMPFLFALFMFFPSAIELRQQSFLWANDLSTYDAVIHWDAYIPLVSPYFGNHISLFCLLMSIVNIVYTKYNMEQTNTGQEQMPGMKAMMYIMPLFMLVFLNSYPAGLNYYYFISTLITIIQTIAFRFVLNEEKLLAKLEANKSKAKPAKKKSGFMARLEEAQRKQQAMLREQQKQRKR